MPETVLDYDKQIWTVFSVGVVASVVILYYVVSENLKEYELLALSLGFAILVYCFFATLGYGIKKRETIRALRRRLHPNRRIYQSIGDRLDNRDYFRSRRMGEAILIFIGFLYFLVFGCKWAWIPLTILIFFT